MNEIKWSDYSFMLCEKDISKDEFCEWLKGLPGRDSMIAALLYFHAPSLEEVLNLKVKDITLSKRTIHFSNLDLVLPLPLFSILKGYCRIRGKEDFIFTNRKGERLERTHLNNSFNRASRKYKKRRITPSDLKKIRRITIE